MSAYRKRAKVPLSSLRLWVPPLRLLSAFLWRVAEQRLVKYYTRLEEFVAIVLEIVPDLLSATERVELLFGLRARFILELCHDQPSVTLQIMQPHLERVSSIAKSVSIDEIGDQTIEVAVRNFLDLIQTLLRNSTYKKHFFQDIYPLHYGPKYDTALQLLVWEFLCRLELVMPVPSFHQASSWFDEDPLLLEDSLEMVNDPKEVQTLLLHFKHFGHLDPGSSSSPILANTILSTLSVSFSVKTVLSRCDQAEKCVSTAHVTQASRNEAVRHRDINEEAQHGDINDGDGHGNVDVLDPQRDTDQGKQRNRDETHFRVKNGHSSEFENPVSNRSEQEDLPSSGQGPGVSPPQDSLIAEGSQSVSTADDSANQLVQQACAELGNAFSKSSLTKNQTGYPGDRPHLCTHCGKRFKCTTHLKDHIRIHTGERPYGCLDCGRRFSRSTHLRQHMRSHSAERPGSNRRKQKVPTPSGEGPRLPPPQDSMEEGSQSVSKAGGSASVDKHKQTHVEEKKAPQKSGIVSRMLIPKLNNTATSRLQHKCTECGKAFFSKSGLSRHKKKHAEERKEKSRVGAKMLTPQSNSATTSGPLRHTCSECGKTFIWKWALTKHQTIHSGERPHLCSYCGKAFRVKNVLECHLRVHTGERPYGCPVCGKRFVQKSNLVAHERLHTGERPYLCSVCGKGFPVSGALLVHTRRHTGERPYTCEFCGKSYTMSGRLAVHRRVHTKEKPYACTMCKKRFRSCSHLKRHIRTHTGEKPYECLQCGKRFSVRSNMNVHQRVHR
ncbi:zinc finger protein 436 isoform X1 [Alosa sapidissima]|uniref:zinc finger protein 436 isoform X1 n=1 Tax=Alosa sapidissima TaxID=34773 RepID=UPI001C084D81|nr:zinc finger protein 436 isoform X1 [Alosa sapidissima]